MTKIATHLRPCTIHPGRRLFVPMSAVAPADIGTNNLLPGWMVHGLKWVAIFVIPLGALWIGQTHSGVSEVQRGAWVVSDLPNGKRAHRKYGIALQDLNRFEEAAQQYRAELEIDPNIEEAHYGLGHVLLAQSKIDEASKHIEQALRSNPRNGDFHSDHGYLLESLGQKDERGTNTRRRFG